MSDEFSIFVDYGSFMLLEEDSQAVHNPERCFVGEGNGLVGTAVRGQIAVRLFAKYEYVLIRPKIGRTTPDVRSSASDIVECSVILHGPLQVLDAGGQSCGVIPTSSNTYRLRISLDKIQEVAIVWLDFWVGPARDQVILKASEFGDQYHESQRMFGDGVTFPDDEFGPVPSDYGASRQGPIAYEFAYEGQAIASRLIDSEFWSTATNSRYSEFAPHLVNEREQVALRSSSVDGSEISMDVVAQAAGSPSSFTVTASLSDEVGTTVVRVRPPGDAPEFLLRLIRSRLAMLDGFLAADGAKKKR